MVVHKRKKVHRYRGSTTYGAGSRKKRRGAGSRGGRGMAGTGKRAGQKKAGLKDFKLGAHGFLPRRGAVHDTVLNLGYFTRAKIDSLLQQGQAKREQDCIIIDLQQLGYTKLLGSGKMQVKLKIIAEKWSRQAEEKVKAVGGEVVAATEG